MGLVIFLVLLLGVAAFAWHRNNWVFDQRGEHIEAVFTFVTKKAREGEFTPGDSHYSCIASYDTMFRKFWLWNLSDFVTDQERFDELYGK